MIFVKLLFELLTFFTIVVCAVVSFVFIGALVAIIFGF